MAQEDLSRLSIDKNTSAARTIRKKRPMRTAAIIIAVLLLVFLVARHFFMPVVDVETATVAKIYPSQSMTLLSASGYVVAQRKAAVASKITGRLISISVEEGNRIRKGDIIARLESEDALAVKDRAAEQLNHSQAGLAQAKSEVADAAANYRRSSELLDKGFISRLEYDAADTRHKKAEAAAAAAEASVRAAAAGLKEAEVILGYAAIRAPFDSVVLTKNADIGDIITPLGAAANAKAAVVTIADMDSLQVEVDVSESNIAQVKVSQPCEIQLDAFPSARFRGQVHMVVPTADRTKATVLVKVRFLDKDPGVLPEMSAKVAFLERKMNDSELAPLTAVSSESIINSNGKNSVFLVKDGIAIETPVTTGEKIGDRIEVLSGVKAGDRIVRRPTEKLRSGSKIKVTDK